MNDLKVCSSLQTTASTIAATVFYISTHQDIEREVIDEIRALQQEGMPTFGRGGLLISTSFHFFGIFNSWIHFPEGRFGDIMQVAR